MGRVLMTAVAEARTTVLAPVLDVTAAAPLREQLLALRGGAAVLDASNVERLGGLCLQVLMAARKAWTADGFTLRLAEPSDALIEQLAAFGAPDLQHVPTEDLG